MSEETENGTVDVEQPVAKRGAIIPLGIKIAGLVAGVVVLLLGAFGWLSAERARTLVEAEVDARGMETARVLAHAIPRVTHTEFGRTWSVMFEDPPVEDVTGEWRFRRQQERKAWLQTFEKLCLGGDIVNIAVVEGDASTLSARPADRFSFTPATGDRDGTWQAGSVATPVRRFRVAIHSHDGSSTFGYLDVYLSLEAIDRARRKTLTSIAVLGAGAIVVGAALSLLIGRTLSSPLRKLVADMAVVRTGDLAHQTHVHSRDEIGMLADAFNEMTSGLRDAELVKAESLRVHNDLRLAQEIQAKLLPMDLPGIPRFDIAACYEPALQVSGDYYDVFPLPDYRFGVTVGDVSGKGIPAALVMTMTRSLLRMGALSGLAPKPLLSRVNSVLFKDLKRGTFVTIAYAVVDPQNGTMTVASAGHNPLCIWLPEQGECMDLQVPGIALGVVEPERFSMLVAEATVGIPQGGRVVMYTDGITEAMDKDGREFGLEALHQLARELPDEDSETFLQSLMTAVGGHRGEADPSDDITVVTFRRLA